MWTIDRVKIELNKLCANDGLDAVRIPVKVNSRLSTTLGRVKYCNLRPTSIEFSAKLLENGTDNDVINVIKHEYVHYFLMITTRENHGHDRVFKNKCAEIGCTHDKTHNALDNDEPTEKEYKYDIYCDNCGVVAHYARRGKIINNIQYCRCGKCGASGLQVFQNW